MSLSERIGSVVLLLCIFLSGIVGSWRVGRRPVRLDSDEVMLGFTIDEEGRIERAFLRGATLLRPETLNLVRQRQGCAGVTRDGARSEAVARRDCDPPLGQPGRPSPALQPLAWKKSIISRREWGCGSTMFP